MFPLWKLFPMLILISELLSCLYAFQGCTCAQKIFYRILHVLAIKRNLVMSFVYCIIHTLPCKMSIESKKIIAPSINSSILRRRLFLFYRKKRAKKNRCSLCTRTLTVIFYFFIDDGVTWCRLDKKKVNFGACKDIHIQYSSFETLVSLKSLN
jgi:hypothetical protein